MLHEHFQGLLEFSKKLFSGKHIAVTEKLVRFAQNQK